MPTRQAARGQFRPRVRHVDLRFLRERIDLPRHFRPRRDHLLHRDICPHGISSGALISVLLQIEGLAMVVQALVQHVHGRHYVRQNGATNQNPRGGRVDVPYHRCFWLPAPVIANVRSLKVRRAATNS